MQLQGRLTSTQEFENIILRSTEAGGLVRLKDVGRVELGGETYGIDAIDLKGASSVGPRDRFAFVLCSGLFPQGFDRPQSC